MRLRKPTDVEDLPDKGQSGDPSDYFQADLTFLFGASFADPDHPTEVGAGRVFIEYKFDYLTAAKVETSAYPETFQRRIEDEAGESLRLAVQVDPQAGASFQLHTLRAATLGDGERHCFFAHRANLGDSQFHCPDADSTAEAGALKSDFWKVSMPVDIAGGVLAGTFPISRLTRHNFSLAGRTCHYFRTPRHQGATLVTRVEN